MANSAPDPGDRVDKRHELRDVVAVTAGQEDGKRGSMAVSDQVMLGTCPAAIDG
ncbi:hypothetical protein GCM10010329_84520 [Streptomyces spiroverticillatus]|uniref:Uncharacterized protein n=1 Tax=Streptomyces finlayi TaxID=67296 RepID=A0A918X9F9_9ACTN|nr:hypothetical protein GCM10010329_84520 [Streptomyces spiroverticillatus]GHD19322.1 hypothetical protein GCM10010334_82840 [Streptomyces finlayi]